MSTICFMSIYKNMHNPKNTISFLLFSFIATMLAKIQDENKQKQEDKKNEEKIREFFF